MKINVKIKAAVPVQVDGEPWMQQPCDISIRPTVDQVAFCRCILITSSSSRVSDKDLHF